MYYLVIIGLSALMISGFLLFRSVLFDLIRKTVRLLDRMLDQKSDERIKQNQMTQALKSTLGALLLFICCFSLVIAVPLLLHQAYLATFGGPDIQSLYFSGSALVGSLIPFFPIWLKKKGRDYNELSVLLHQIILNNPNLGLGLFSAEKRFFRKKLRRREEEFVIVSGLARAGTTALTQTLYRSGNFHSLSYADMPFLAAPNIWSKFSNHSQKQELRERSHKDGVMISNKSVEALEEFFWKTQLDDKFISDNHLIPHDIDQKVYQDYLDYQELIKSKPDNDTCYLAKNNNFILRYEAIRQLNEKFHLLLLFRDPLEQAYSLLKQHRRYKKLQTEDDFVRQYMVWLGHHEFGLEHKSFDFPGQNIGDKMSEDSLDYWLAQWINYYTYVLQLNHHRVHFIQYEDFLQEPKRTLNAIEKTTGMAVAVGQFEVEKFEKHPTCKDLRVEQTIKTKASEVFETLKKKKLSLNFPGLVEGSAGNPAHA